MRTRWIGNGRSLRTAPRSCTQRNSYATAVMRPALAYLRDDYERLGKRPGVSVWIGSRVGTLAGLAAVLPSQRRTSLDSVRSLAESTAAGVLLRDVGFGDTAWPTRGSSAAASRRRFRWPGSSWFGGGLSLPATDRRLGLSVWRGLLVASVPLPLRADLDEHAACANSITNWHMQTCTRTQPCTAMRAYGCDMCRMCLQGCGCVPALAAAACCCASTLSIAARSPSSRCAMVARSSYLRPATHLGLLQEADFALVCQYYALSTFTAGRGTAVVARSDTSWRGDSCEAETASAPAK